MIYRKMNGTGIYVSDLCLGTMMFGSKTDKKESQRIIDLALSHGVNYIDTADVYSGGESERIIGEALVGRREDLILATKARFNVGNNVNNHGLNRRHLLKQVDRSLLSLQTDYIDIFYLHAMDDGVPYEEMLDTMDSLIHSGKIRYIGVSNFPAWQVSELLAVAKANRYNRPIVTQNMYNVVTREIEPELIPCIVKNKMGLTVYNPIAGGLLTGKYDLNSIPNFGRFSEKPNYMDRYWRPDILSAVKDLNELTASYGRSLLSASLKWCLAHDFVDSVVCGVSTYEQMDQNLKAIGGEPLRDEEIEAMDAIGSRIMAGRISYFK